MVRVKPARASALVPVALADELERHPPAEAKILAIHRELAPAMSQVEIVLALPGNPPVGSTISLPLHGPARTGPAVPRSALLRTATGLSEGAPRGTVLVVGPEGVGNPEVNAIAGPDGMFRIRGLEGKIPMVYSLMAKSGK